MIRKAAYFFSGLCLLFFLGMVLFLFLQSLPAWKNEGLSYVIGKIWYYRSEAFGLLSMIYGTLWVSLLSLLLAAPIGIAAAIYISEYSGGKARILLKILVELLAGVPSVVYGLIGVLILRNWVCQSLSLRSGDTLLTASLLLAVMILPTIVSLSEDALKGVPRRFAEASRAMGMNKAQTIIYSLLPSAKVGLISSCLLGLGRALGETIAVFLVVGRADNRLPENLFSLKPLFEAGQTLTSKLGGSEVNLAYGDPLHWGAICGAAFVLLSLALLVYIFGELLIFKNPER